MSIYSRARTPHPIQDPAVADHNRRTICEIRGFCGPFINEHYYNDFLDPIWRGTGECVVCCNTCNVAVEHEKRRAAIARGHRAPEESEWVDGSGADEADGHPSGSALPTST